MHTSIQFLKGHGYWLTGTIGKKVKTQFGEFLQTSEEAMQRAFDVGAQSVIDRDGFRNFPHTTTIACS